MSRDLDVARIAHLARLELTADEIAGFQAEIAAILQHVEKLSEVDVDGIEPTAHAVPVTNVTRADEPGACLDREAVLKNAPAVLDDELIQVPVVVTEGH